MAYITVDEVRQHQDIDSTTDDALILDLIDAAQEAIDTYCQRTFEATADTTRYIDAIGEHVDGFTLYLEEDLCAVTTVTNGDSVEVSSSEYTTIQRNRTPWYALKILPSAGKSWTFTTDYEGAISILGRWAYSTTPPADVKHACKELAAFFYRRREMPTADVTAIEAGILVRPFAIPATVRALLDPYKVMS